MTDDKNFAKLVECAEQYIVEKAEKVLLFVRDNKEELKTEYHERCKELLKDYHPICDDVNKITFKSILKRFCIQLQNYKAMPKAIDYASYSSKEKENSLLALDYFSDDNELYNAIYNYFNDQRYKEEIKKAEKQKETETKGNQEIEEIDESDTNTDNDINKGFITYHLPLYRYLKNYPKNKDADQEKGFFDETSKAGRCLDNAHFFYTEKEWEVKDKKPEDLKSKDKKYIKGKDKAENDYKEVSKTFRVNDKEIKGTKNQNQYWCYYNSAWYRYTRGIMDVFIDINKAGGDDEYTEYIKCIAKLIDDEKNDEIKFEDVNNDFLKKKLTIYFNKKIKTKKEKNQIGEYSFTKYDILDAFCLNIHYLGLTLSRDFFKELYCQNLIKDDVHILECYKHCIDETADITSDKGKAEVVKKFLALFKQYKEQYKKDDDYTPYYIDKILWLCCTGSFYEDGIIINKMNRKKFLDYFDEYIKKKKNAAQT